MTHPRLLRTLVILAFVLVLASCAPNQEVRSAVDRQRAIDMATHALVEGYNRGSYAAYSRDWAPAMKQAIGEDAFQAFRTQATAQAGAFRSLRDARLVRGRQPGYVRWEFLCDFEHGPIVFALGFAREGTRIEGAFFDVPSAAWE